MTGLSVYEYMLKILLAGDGGQGIQLLSHIICESAFHLGLEVTHIPNYGLEQRGGVSLAFIKIGKEKIVYPKFRQADLMLIMSPQAEERTLSYVDSTSYKLQATSYKEFFNREKLLEQSHNIFFLGKLLRILKEKGLVDIEYAKKLLVEKLSNKPGWEENQKAFELGSSK